MFFPVQERIGRKDGHGGDQADLQQREVAVALVTCGIVGPEIEEAANLRRALEAGRGYGLLDFRGVQNRSGAIDLEIGGSDLYKAGQLQRDEGDQQADGHGYCAADAPGNRVQYSLAHRWDGGDEGEDQGRDKADSQEISVAQAVADPQRRDQHGGQPQAADLNQRKTGDKPHQHAAGKGCDHGEEVEGSVSFSHFGSAESFCHEELGQGLHVHEHAAHAQEAEQDAGGNLPARGAAAVNVVKEFV